ncbi:MAG TPA: malic enzyme-like NAD(P)-binding protein [Candidatus Bathyarchaeia archaeon]|nr:malic enzyme-like NAD(P)-binding protein [Candidatus Bathyarchaeia archaeon]
MCVYTVTEGRLPLSLMLGVMLDMGTNRQRLQDDPEYKGIKAPRLGSEDPQYQKAMRVIKTAYQRLGIGFVMDEDFAGSEAWLNIRLARELNDRSLNDDVEGTGSLMAEILLLAELLGINIEHSQIIGYGAGGAGTGIFDQAREVFCGQIPEEEIFRTLFWFLDSAGLLVADRRVKESQGRAEFRSFQQELGLVIGQADPRWAAIRDFRQGVGRGSEEQITLAETIRLATQKVQEHDDGAIFLYGFAATADAFNDEVIQALAEARVPVFMVAGSNPFEACEILTSEDLAELRRATGKEEKQTVVRRRIERLYRVFAENGGNADDLRVTLGSAYLEFTRPDGGPGIVAQGNNLFTFGAMVEAVMVARLSRLTLQMKAEAARAGARFMRKQERENFDLGALYPERAHLAEVILAKTAALILVGLMDQSVEVGNPDYAEIRTEIGRMREAGKSDEEIRKEGLLLVKALLDKSRWENVGRTAEVIAARRRLQPEPEVAQKAFNQACRVLDDKGIGLAAKTITAKTS